MNPGNVQADPWLKILDLLNQCGPSETAKGCPAVKAKSLNARVTNTTRTGRRGRFSCREPQGFRACVTIYVRELTESSAVIGWCDSTRCRYEDQRWCRVTARRAGVCALTGTLIVAGADVYHPARTRSGPVNAGAMILTGALQRLMAADLAPR
jgi:hypothetical protein